MTVGSVNLAKLWRRLRPPRATCPKCGARVNAAQLAAKEARYHRTMRLLGADAPFELAVGGQLLDGRTTCGCCETASREGAKA